MHKFDRIYSIDGPQAMPGRIVAHQDDNGDTFTVLAYFPIAKHNTLTFSIYWAKDGRSIGKQTHMYYKYS